MTTLKKIWFWCKNNFKVVLSILASILLFIFAASWYSKNKLIRKLENELGIIRSKAELDRLVFKYEATVKKLQELKKDDKELQDQLDKVEISLHDKLSPDMTLEEIMAEFRRIGIEPED